METLRYHKDVYMPNLNLDNFWKGLNVWCTKHFLERLNERKSKYRGMFIPTIAQLKSAEIFEVYISSSKQVERLCLRLEGSKSDYCYVLASNGALITAWATGKYNKYDKIDRTIYCKKGV